MGTFSTMCLSKVSVIEPLYHQTLFTVGKTLSSWAATNQAYCLFVLWPGCARFRRWTPVFGMKALVSQPWYRSEGLDVNMGTDRVLPGLRCSPQAYSVQDGWIMYSICLCTYVTEERHTEMLREKRVRTSLLCGRSIHKTEDYVLWYNVCFHGKKFSLALFTFGVWFNWFL